MILVKEKTSAFKQADHYADEKMFALFFCFYGFFVITDFMQKQKVKTNGKTNVYHGLVNPWSTKETTIRWVDVHNLEGNLEITWSNLDWEINFPNHSLT